MGNKPDHGPDQFFAFFVTTDLARKACTHAHFNSHMVLFYSKACREKGSQISGFFSCGPFYFMGAINGMPKNTPVTASQPFPSLFTSQGKKCKLGWGAGMFDLISFGVLHPFLKAPSRGRMGAWRKGLGHPPVPSSNVKTQACGCKDWCVFHVDSYYFPTSWTSFSSRSGRPCT